MLADKELEQTAAQLANFRTANEQHHETLSEVLQKYAALMEDYKRLRSDYEEERDSRERYKQMARGQERNPFVLVLIDGDGYVFDDDLVSNGAEGGQKAARLLDNAVKDSLRGRGLDHCRIMVRIYANLAGLSKALSKAKLTGPEKRSLAPFTASFTRANDLFDFVDAGDLKENADFKIRAMFRQYVDNTQCRHVYFAGCHDVGYLSELSHYSGNRDRITLVRSPAFHHEFSKLGMRVEEFPNIFRALPLDGAIATKAPLARPTETTSSPPPAPSDTTATICAFYQKGTCKYGKACRNSHIKANADGSTTAAHTAGSLSDIRDWRQNSSGSKSTLPFQMPQIAKNDNDFMTGLSANLDPMQVQIEFSTKLPQVDDIPRNEVPVNKHQHRLDPYIPPPSSEERATFTARIANKKLCNNYHILHNCPNSAEDCEYDHNPVSPAILNCLKQVVRNNPCPRRGGCRTLTCLNGHVCQKAECRYRGGKLYCKFGPSTHTVDLQVTEFVLGTGHREDTEYGAVFGGVSSKSSTPPVSGARGMNEESEEERETEEGALLDFGDDTPLD